MHVRSLRARRRRWPPARPAAQHAPPKPGCRRRDRAAARLGASQLRALPPRARDPSPEAPGRPINAAQARAACRCARTQLRGQGGGAAIASRGGTTRAHEGPAQAPAARSGERATMGGSRLLACASRAGWQRKSAADRATCAPAPGKSVQRCWLQLRGAARIGYCGRSARLHLTPERCSRGRHGHLCCLACLAERASRLRRRFRVLADVHCCECSTRRAVRAEASACACAACLCVLFGLTPREGERRAAAGGQGK